MLTALLATLPACAEAAPGVSLTLPAMSCMPLLLTLLTVGVLVVGALCADASAACLGSPSAATAATLDACAACLGSPQLTSAASLDSASAAPCHDYLGYGQEGFMPVVPPAATLTYEVELLDFSAEDDAGHV